MTGSIVTAKDIAFGGVSDDDHVFRRVSEGHYRLSVPAVMAEFDVDRLYRDRHELSGELLVTCGIAGARTFDGLLSSGNFNLSSTRARQERARQLRDRAQTSTGIDWDGLLEELCARVIQAERTGTPARLLCTYERPTPADTFDIEGLALLKLHPVMLFGDGGTAKAIWLSTLPANSPSVDTACSSQIGSSVARIIAIGSSGCLVRICRTSCICGASGRWSLRQIGSPDRWKNLTSSI